MLATTASKKKLSSCGRGGVSFIQFSINVGLTVPQYRCPCNGWLVSKKGFLILSLFPVVSQEKSLLRAVKTGMTFSSRHTVSFF